MVKGHVKLNFCLLINKKELCSFRLNYWKNVHVRFFSVKIELYAGEFEVIL